ncbi:MAG: hypothetical protein N2045_05110 [Fimbriimonadales bacterium]|jgi:ATP-dependent Clp protease ATP-binding subunit ClpA|nr:hypothetical protein [Fimbriimonadales bacterium]
MLDLLRGWIDSVMLFVESALSRLVAYVGGVSWHRMSEVARKVYYDAARLAQTYKHSEIQPEHLLLAILSQRQGVVAQVMEDLGIDIESLRMRIRQHLSLMPSDLVHNNPTLSIQARDATRIALAQAAQSPERWVGTHHILYGIVCQRDSVASRMLQEVGLTEERIYSIL